MDYAKLLREERRKILQEVAQKSLRERDEDCDDNSTLIRTVADKANLTVPASEQLSFETFDICFNIPPSVISESIGDISTSDKNFLDTFMLDTPMPRLYYLPDVIDPATERSLVDAIDKYGGMGLWKELSSRRLQLYGQLPKGQYSIIPDATAPIPEWLDNVLSNEALAKLFPVGWRPNNVLINQYDRYQGIMHHTDGPSYKDFVIILSLESDCIMTFKPKLHSVDIGVQSDSDVLSVCLRARSLLIFSEDLYTSFMHGIYENPEPEVNGIVHCANLMLSNASLGEKVVHMIQ